MPVITRESLLSLESYSKQRKAWKEKIIPHKKARTLHVGNHVTLIFEDEFTIRYQIQEMLRIEKTFEEEGILDELEAYGPLVPDGSNFKATMMIEYGDPELRAQQLRLLKGIEDVTWVRVDGFDKVFAIADEDLERENAEKTSAVHFLRFELSPAMCAALKAGAALGVGIDHAHYSHAVDEVAPQTQAALVKDLS
ncbi:DUF3501 family protein [Limnobacter humi]|uniref:DUF3501 family protein n=1 Tax=Limnobacter humi TaxID=1778671 RepID=A0ABT1WD87_9BURK|nr:DUF3501 family protein [Limnobacter humi]MCQ8895488.1 DUF3501 family protein [Limnobacter humi]